MAKYRICLQSLLASFILLAVVATGCQISRAGSGTWQQLPPLTKPQIAENSDKGGEFRTVLNELAKIKLAETEKLQVVVTLWDLAYFGGGMSSEVADISVIVNQPTDLYKFQPNKEEVLPILKKAHVVFRVGYGLDDWIDPLIEEAKVENPKLLTVDLTRNIDMIGNLWNPDPLNRSQIAEYNPWFWLDPDNVMPIADTFFQIFLTLKPTKDEAMRKGSDILQNNIGIFPSSQQQLKMIDKKVVVQDVPVWPYFAKYFDMKITDTLMKDGKTEPTEEELNAMVKQAKTDGVIAVIKTTGYGGEVANKFAKLMGDNFPVIELDPHPRMGQGQMADFFQQTMGNANRLLMKFREIGLPEKALEPEPNPQGQQQPGANVQIPEDVRKQLEEAAKKKEQEGSGKEQPGEKPKEKPDEKPKEKGK